MTHRHLQVHAQMKSLIYIDCNRFGPEIRAMTGDESLKSAAIWKKLNDFYSTLAEDGDIELVDAAGNPCTDIDAACRIAMNTGLRTETNDAVWIHGSRARGRKNIGVFWAQYLSVRYAELEGGHRLLGLYQDLKGFVYLYPRYLAENLVENAGAVLGPVQSQSYIVHRLTDAYRRAADEEIRITRNGEPCNADIADEIVLPTGYFTPDGEMVYMHCEPSDAGRDYPWCLHFFRAAGQEIPDVSATGQINAEEKPNAEQTTFRGLWERIMDSVFRRK